MRSKLFVPGSRAELFVKALAGDADAISFDVEDSVPEDSKARAREQVADFLRSRAVRDSAKVMIVRINALDSRHFEGDLMAFACPQVALLNLPKAQCAADVQAAVAALERAERRNGVERPIRLLINIETPRAVRLAAEIATAHSRVAGLQLGLADLFESLHIDRTDPARADWATSVRAACIPARSHSRTRSCGEDCDEDRASDARQLSGGRAAGQSSDEPLVRSHTLLRHWGRILRCYGPATNRYTDTGLSFGYVNTVSGNLRDGRDGLRG